MLVTDRIQVPTPCDSRTISFANEFFLMDFVGPLVRCLYYIYVTVVGSMTTLYWCCPCRFVINTDVCCAVDSTLVTHCVCAMVLYRCVALGKSYLLPV